MMSCDNRDNVLELRQENIIGTGSYGIIWKVVDPRNNRKLAVKKICHVFQNLVSCKRAFREIKMLASFRHDNVVSALEIIIPNDPHYYRELFVVTELMESDLYRVITMQQLSIEHVQLFTYQLLRGVKYLHSANIIHRDLKPGNLLVNGGNCMLKICDFGMARTFNSKNQKNLTFDVVTQSYRPPELLMGSTCYTSSVDIWSVGCIMAEMLLNRILFQADTPIQLLDNIIALLGSPPESDMWFASPAARRHVIQQPPKMADNYRLIQSPQNTQAADKFLRQLLQFNPSKRVSASMAISSEFVDVGRSIFHSTICSCCDRNGKTKTGDYDPSHPEPLDPNWEDSLPSMTCHQYRVEIFNFIAELKYPMEKRLSIKNY